MKKLCVGICKKTVEETTVGLGIATICDACRIPLDQIPKSASRAMNCPHCGGPMNFIGATKWPEVSSALYFDCPNPACAKRRTAFVLIPRPNAFGV